MATIYHQVSIDAPLAKVYDAISTADGIGTWWDKQTPNQTDRGLVLEHNPGPEHTHPRSSPASAWTGTHFIFEIAERDNGSSGSKHNQVRATTLDFRQAGYDERSEFFGSNNFAWGQVLQKLKQVVESESS